jgi:hypothetical protein
MNHRVAIAALIGALLVGPGAFAACPAPAATKYLKDHPKPHKPGDDCVDLNGLPQISDHIAALQPAAAPAKTAGPFDPGKPSYEGPTLGLTKPEPGVKPAPTVGYRWLLD